MLDTKKHPKLMLDTKKHPKLMLDTKKHPKLKEIIIPHKKIVVFSYRFSVIAFRYKIFCIFSKSVGKLAQTCQVFSTEFREDTVFFSSTLEFFKCCHYNKHHSSIFNLPTNYDMRP